MKSRRLFFGVLFMLFCCLLSAQTLPSETIRLGAGGQVINTIIYNNPSQRPVSDGVFVTHCASEYGIGESNGNLSYLLISPFTLEGYHIDLSSVAYNAGTLLNIRTFDTLDLDGNPRVACKDSIDMGAYEFPIQTTQITKQPSGANLCEGTPWLLETVAVGDNVGYQWQRNGVPLLGQTEATLKLLGETSESGTYRAIAYGDCCSDTSAEAHVQIDFAPTLELMHDTAVLPGEDVLLHTVSYSGTLQWFEYDGVTPLNDLLITNITTPQRYVATTHNGVCPDTVKKMVNILISGLPCKIYVSSSSDVTLCEGDTYTLQPNLENTTAIISVWREIGSGTEYEPGAIIHPTDGMRLIAIGETSEEICESTDTLTIRIIEVHLAVMSEVIACNGDRNVYLTSEPAVGVTWRNEYGEVEGTENTWVLAPLRRETYYHAELRVGNCYDRDSVRVYVNSTYFNVSPKDTAICEGQYVLLSDDAEPGMVVWKDLSSGETLKSLFVNPYTTTIYESTYEDPFCGSYTTTAMVEVKSCTDDFSLETYYGEGGCLPGDGYAGVIATGQGSPYTYLWSNGAETQQINNLLGGHYRVTVTSIQGTSQVAVVEVPTVTEINVTVSTVHPSNEQCDNGSARALASGGSPDYTYYWDNGTWGANLTNTEAGLYELMVTDSRLCSKTVEVALSCVYKPRVMPSLFISPNNDGKNDFLMIKNMEKYPINSVLIFNAYGEEVWRATGYDNDKVKWDGRNLRREVLPDGIYYYVVKAEGVDVMVGWLLMKLSKSTSYGY